MVSISLFFVSTSVWVTYFAASKSGCAKESEAGGNPVKEPSQLRTDPCCSARAGESSGAFHS